MNAACWIEHPVLLGMGFQLPNAQPQAVLIDEGQVWVIDHQWSSVNIHIPACYGAIFRHHIRIIHMGFQVTVQFAADASLKVLVTK